MLRQKKSKKKKLKKLNKNLVVNNEHSNKYAFKNILLSIHSRKQNKLIDF